MTSDRIVDNTGDVIEHGDHGLTLSPERRKDVEASIRAAGLTSRAARRGDTPTCANAAQMGRRASPNGRAR